MSSRKLPYLPKLATLLFDDNGRPYILSPNGEKITYGRPSGSDLIVHCTNNGLTSVTFTIFVNTIENKKPDEKTTKQKDSGPEQSTV